jgi:hypothetical protein
VEGKGNDMSKTTRKCPRNSIIHALVLQWNVSRLTGRKFEPKKGKGAKYKRQDHKEMGNNV